MDDISLVRDYAERGSEDAFTALVRRHINMVYSVALRQTGNSSAAQEITQAVFIILARKARGLSKGTIVSGWLYQTARLTAANYLRTEFRRARREQEAYMQSLESQTDEAWRQIVPLLDGAIGTLAEKDRNAIVLRFFERKPLSRVGAALGVSEDAAKMRVNRALEKLRNFFSKRGVVLSATIIASAVAANSVQAAPAGLTASLTGLAVTEGAAVSSSTLALVDAVLKALAWAKAKVAIVMGMGVLITAGTTALVMNGVVPMSNATRNSFGPIHETFLDNSGSATFLDLDTARVLPDYKGSRSQFDDWIRDNGADIALPKLVTSRNGESRFELNGEKVRLPDVATVKEGVCSFELKRIRFHNSSWKEMSAAEILQNFPRFASGFAARTNDFVLSGTYVFKTREGGEGIMQISLYNPYPRSMRVRYKLVQQ